MESSWILALGTKRTFIRERQRPEAMQTSIVPIPMASMELPLKPFTVNEGIGLSILKSPLSGEI